MKESVTYQAILEEGEEKGRAAEARKILLKQGSKRFGTPDTPVQAALEAVSSLEQLEMLAERLLEVESWQELLT